MGEQRRGYLKSDPVNWRWRCVQCERVNSQSFQSAGKFVGEVTRDSNKRFLLTLPRVRSPILRTGDTAFLLNVSWTV